MFPHALEPPSNHLDSTSSEPTFPLILTHNFHFLFLLFMGRTKEQAERSAETMSALRSPTVSPPQHCPPPNLPIIPCQGKHHKRIAPFHISVRLWRNFRLRFVISFLHALTLFFLRYFLDERWRRGISEIKRKNRRRILIPSSGGMMALRWQPPPCQTRGGGLTLRRHLRCYKSHMERMRPSPWGPSDIWRITTTTATVTMADEREGSRKRQRRWQVPTVPTQHPPVTGSDSQVPLP